LGGLPLALDQAGAYIEETGCSLREYQRLFQRRSVDLLARRGGLVEDHPRPVATTWSLSFEKIEQKNPAAADLLRVCAYLAPDAIPETIMTKGAQHLGLHLASVGEDPYLLNKAIEALRAYSLLRREVSGEAGTLLSTHRLVQAVLHDGMEESERQAWAERVVLALAAAFPSVKHQSWPLCEQLLPHALCGVALITRYEMSGSQVASLLNQMGLYLSERARFQEAEPLLERALLINEQELGEKHPDTARSLNNLASLYQEQGKDTEAEPLYRRALLINEQELGALHPITAKNLSNLAGFCCTQGRYAEAELFYERALLINELVLGALHPDTATSLNNLAQLYYWQEKYTEAEPLFKRALSICEQELGAVHPNTATSLNNLALLYEKQRMYTEAEALAKRALAMCEQELGDLHPLTATTLNNLGLIYERQGMCVEAEPLMKRALWIKEQVLGQDHPQTHTIRKNYTRLLQRMKRNAP
jgi:tetratricopeptide (TPR) repeat protein